MIGRPCCEMSGKISGWEKVRVHDVALVVKSV
jgi:hypothetical protein